MQRILAALRGPSGERPLAPNARPHAPAAVTRPPLQAGDAHAGYSHREGRIFQDFIRTLKAGRVFQIKPRKPLPKCERKTDDE